MTEPLRLAVCMTTFRRPDGMLRALEGLERLVFPQSGPVDIDVFVVDNDADAPMSPIVEAHGRGSRWRVHYSCEGRRGVSSARNRCLDLVPEEAVYMAFLDDDEVPVPHWLDELVAAARRHGAEIVQGPVRSLHAEGTPTWVTRGRYLELGPFEDGETLRYGFSGNVLMATAMLRRLGLRFDPRFDHSGGEDQHFFVCAMRAGVRIVATPGALVDEWVPASRGRLDYLVKRKFRIGSTLSMISLIEGDRLPDRAMRAAKGVGRIGLGAAQLPSVLWRGRNGLAEGLMNAALGLGTLAGLAGVTHREYARIHGSGGHERAASVAAGGKERP